MLAGSSNLDHAPTADANAVTTFQFMLVHREDFPSGPAPEGKVAFFLSEGDDPSLISDWIPTGSSLLDLAISNRPNGGIPVGRITELTGLEQSGKSLISGGGGV